MEIFREYEDLVTQNPKLLEEKYKNRLRFIKTPLLRTSCLYWAIQFCTKGDAEDIELIRELLTFTNVIPELQLKATKMQNCFHACCDNGNEVALKLLLEGQKDRYKAIYKKYQKNLSVDKNQTPEEIKAARKKFKAEQSKRIFEFLDDELKTKKYTKKFMKYVKKTSDWILEFEKRIFEGARDDFANIRPFEDQDDFGNTPLHIASLKGRVECVEALLEAGIFFLVIIKL
jgi:FOG: Ankyrin repeat